MTSLVLNTHGRINTKWQDSKIKEGDIMSEMDSRKQSGTVTCPKCGTNFRSFTLDEIVCPKCKTRSGKREINIALVVIALILLVLIGLFAPSHKRPDYNSSTTSTGSSTPESSYSSSETERTRKNYEQDERRRQRDALQPTIIEMCRQGNDEACREAKHWEDIR